MNLQDKVILITGGSSGIGLATARLLLAAHNQVVICGRNPAKLEKARSSLPGVHTIVCDITCGEAVDAMLLEIEQHYGRLDVLINNAGIQYNYLLPEGGDVAQKIAQEIAINFTALVDVTQRALPLLLQKSQAVIVNVGSGTGLIPKLDGIVYSATKAAVHSFTTGLRWQLEATGVQVFELFPPVVDTAMTAGRDEAKVTPETVAEALLAGIERNQQEIFVGKIKALPLLIRFAPGIAQHMMKKD